MVQVYKHAKSPKHAARRAEEIDVLLDVELFRALGDFTRVRLLSCLAKCGRPCSVSEVAECCSVDFSVVSRHLALLARAGVVISSKSGRVVSYQVQYKKVSGILKQLAEAFEKYIHSHSDGGCCGENVR